MNSDHADLKTTKPEARTIWLVVIIAPYRRDYLEREMPLALMYLSGALKQKGYQTRIWELQEDEIEVFIEEARTERPLFIGLSSTFGVMAPSYRDLAHRIKTVTPDLPIIIGGINVTSCPEPYLKEQCFDYCAIGEGEETIQEFADAIASGADMGAIKGLAYLRDGNPVFNEARPRLRDIDQFNLDFEGIDVNNYVETLLDGTRVLKTYQTSRGCPFNCAFCYNSTFPQRLWRPHSIEYILRDIDYLKSRYDFSAIQLTDDHFFVNRKWSFSVMEELHERGIRLINLDIRASDMDRELFENLKKFNCNSIFFGFDSENPRVLEFMNKHMTAMEVVSGLEAAAAYPEIKVFAQIIIGIPTHTWAEMIGTVRYMTDLLEKYPNFFCYISPYMPLPGSTFYFLAKEKGFKGYETIDDFTTIGVKYQQKGFFKYEWLDLPRHKKDDIRNASTLSDFFMKTLFVHHNFGGLINLVNRPFYLAARYRIRNLKTSFMLEARIYDIFVKTYETLVRLKLLKLPANYSS